MNTIAVDIDDVLANTTKCLVDDYAASIGRIIPYGDITSYDYWRNLGVSSDEDAIDIVHAFEKRGYPGLKPVDGALETLTRLAIHNRLIIVTARPEALREITEQWIQSNFDNLFSDLILGGNPYTSKNHTTKAVICSQQKASLLIDDQYKHLEEASRLGIVGLLFGQYEWSYEGGLLPSITRVSDWPAIGEYFNDESFQSINI